MRQNPPNARFWVYWNDSWARLTLRPGESITLRAGGPTEEGRFYSEETYTHDGDSLRLEWYSDATDCDGRLERSGESVAPIDRLNCREVETWKDGELVRDYFFPLLPEWETGSTSQRDHAAESAGY